MARRTFKSSLERTEAVRGEIAADLLPLFDHVIRLAKDSHAHGYFKRSGRELLHARRLVALSARKRNPARSNSASRKGTNMARRSAKQKAAFRKMVAGLRKYKRARKRRSGGARKRRRVVGAVVRRRRKSRGGSRRRRSMTGRALLVRSNPKKRRSPMVRRRRRRRHGVTAVMVNPRRRRRGHARRRRNPSGIVGTLISVAVPATLAAGGLAFVDTKLLGDKSAMVRLAVKVAAAGGVAFLLRRKPELARVMIAAVFASIAQDAVRNAIGGVSAPTAVAAAAQLKQLVLEDPIAGRQAMGVLVEGSPARLSGMGARLDNTVGLSGPIEQSANVLPPGGHFQSVSLG